MPSKLYRYLSVATLLTCPVPSPSLADHLGSILGHRRHESGLCAQESMWSLGR